MKSVITLIAFAAITSGMLSCQKSNSNRGDENQLQTEATQNAADEYNVQTNEQSLSADASTAVAVDPSFSTSSGATDNSIIAGAIVDRSSVTASIKKIKIVYNGVAVSGIIRTGEIIIELVSGSNWINAGAVLKITLNNVKVTYLGKSFTYNGTGYITNVSGGLAYIAPETVVHTLRVNATVTFNDNSILSWWAARKNTYYQNDLSFSSAGDTLVNGETCTMGGVSRYNKDFIVKAPQAIASNAACGFYKPVSGTRIFTSDHRNTTVTFGVNENGASVNSGDCAYGYKVEWTTWNGGNATLIASY